MQTFVNCLADQCRRHRLDAELVIVEWNPPEDQPSLSHALKWPKPNPSCRVRIVQVPPPIHHRFKHSNRLPLFQMIAKNVGIRRARAPFILATNIDILFSEELIAYLARRPLDPRYMYRVDRCDVPAELPEGLPVPELLDFCGRNVLRIYKRWGTLDAKVGRYEEGAVTWKTFVYDALMMISGRRSEKRLHTNASGDFMLLSKEHWFRIRGYPQLEILAMHIDGLGCQIAYFEGAKQRVLTRPLEIFHIDHSVGDNWQPEGDGALTARSKALDVPQLDYRQYRELAISMRRERRGIIVNDENWGLAEEALPEIVPDSAGEEVESARGV